MLKALSPVISSAASIVSDFSKTRREARLSDALSRIDGLEQALNHEAAKNTELITQVQNLTDSLEQSQARYSLMSKQIRWCMLVSTSAALLTIITIIFVLVRLH
jgi:hypothetical protein